MVAGRISTTHKNRTYESTTGPDICLYRKSEGKEPNSATWVTRLLFFFHRFCELEERDSNGRVYVEWPEFWENRRVGSKRGRFIVIDLTSVLAKMRRLIRFYSPRI